MIFFSLRLNHGKKYNVWVKWEYVGNKCKIIKIYKLVLQKLIYFMSQQKTLMFCFELEMTQSKSML